MREGRPAAAKRIHVPEQTKWAEHLFDVIIVGGGGAGLYAALELARHPDLKVAVLSKLHPLRSHTGAAQGGIGAALGHAEEDIPSGTYLTRSRVGITWPTRTPWRSSAP